MQNQRSQFCVYIMRLEMVTIDRAVCLKALFQLDESVAQLFKVANKTRVPPLHYEVKIAIAYCTHKNCSFGNAAPCSPVTKIAVSQQIYGLSAPNLLGYSTFMNLTKLFKCFTKNFPAQPLQTISQNEIC